MERTKMFEALDAIAAHEYKGYTADYIQKRDKLSAAIAAFARAEGLPLQFISYHPAERYIMINNKKYE